MHPDHPSEPASSASEPAQERTRVLLACAGLDHAHRGFETFARECFAELRDFPGIEIQLAKGSGQVGAGERLCRTLTRDSRLARGLGRLSGRDPFQFEHLAFGLSLQPLLRSYRPAVVYFSEWHTGRALAFLRRRTGAGYRLVLCNGTMALERFGHLDLVQELTPTALEAVIAHGADPGRHVLLPLGFEIAPDFVPVSSDERSALRARLALPEDRRIVVSVAALNRSHKRLDYLISELARLSEPRPYALLVGQREPETADIERRAEDALGTGNFSTRTVPAPEVADLCRASDVFVLASLGEGLPRALVEALAAGLPCVTHDYGVSRFVLDDHGRFADLSVPGALAGLLAEEVGERNGEQAIARHRSARARFSWDGLRPRYNELFEHALSMPLTTGRSG